MPLDIQDVRFSSTQNPIQYNTKDSGSGDGRYSQIVAQRLSSEGDNGITLQLSPKNGLVATFKSYGGARFVDLPVTGVPSEYLKGSTDKLQQFLARTYWLPSKGSSGEVEKVTIHPALNGGGQAKIPFQEGLALGSIVRGDLIDKMNRYGEQQAERESLQQQLETIDQRYQELGSKITKLDAEIQKAKEDKKDTNMLGRRRGLLAKEAVVLQKYMNALFEKIDNLQIDDIEVFSHFSSGLTSPIDIFNSEVAVQPNGFDSLTFTSDYVNLKEESSHVSDKVSQASNSGSFSASVSGGNLFFKANASASSSWANATADRVNSIKQRGESSGVLVMNAMVTTRNVRLFKNIKFDLDRLARIYELMQKGTPETFKRDGITLIPTSKMDDQGKPVLEPAIYMLTQAVLGGSFTTLVTFSDTQSTDKTAEMHKSESSSTTSASVGASTSWFGIGGSVGASGSRSRARQSEEDDLKSVANTQIKIDIIAQGVIPAFARETMEREIMRELNLNPAKYELSQQDIQDVEKLIRPGTVEDKAVIEAKHQLKMENAQVALMNTLRGLTAEKETLSLHTAESAMKAYENFTDHITNDKDCGIPVGFNYDVLTMSKIQEILIQAGKIKPVSVEENKKPEEPADNE